MPGQQKACPLVLRRTAAGRSASGMRGAAAGYLGRLHMAGPEQDWHFVVCEVGRLPETWTHRTGDGGGLDFEFFWHPLSEPPDEAWHPVFREALAFIAGRIDMGRAE